MIVTMDLNASPLPDDDEEPFDIHSEVYVPEDHQETAVETARREREERRRRLKREHQDERSFNNVSHPPTRDQWFQNKSFKTYDKSKLPPGWLECPPYGQEIGCIIPSKVPLSEAFNDYVIPGKRYSFKQVIHQQRVLGRKLGLVIDLTNTHRYYPASDWKKEGIKHVKDLHRIGDWVFGWGVLMELIPPMGWIACHLESDKKRKRIKDFRTVWKFPSLAKAE